MGDNFWSEVNFVKKIFASKIKLPTDIFPENVIKIESEIFEIYMDQTMTKNVAGDGRS